MERSGVGIVAARVPSLYEQLIACTVRITAGDRQGSGFFVAPGRIVTSKHVVPEANRNPPLAQIHYQGQKYDVLSIDCAPTDDLSLLEANIPEHPCVLLEEHYSVREPIFFYGFPGQAHGWRGEGGSAQCDGLTTDASEGAEQQFIKFTPGGVRPGMSGGPLLNERTGSVCGVLKRTRNPDIDQGGFAVPVTALWKAFPKLRGVNEEYHRDHREWSAAYAVSASALTQVFARGPAQLSGRIPIVGFQTLIDSRSAEFVGREFVFQEIDTAVGSMPSGYILITAEPGYGKTALMSYLAKTRGYVHHFNVTALNICSPRQFIENITAQIILKYGLEPRPLPPNVSDYGNYFVAVLEDAAAHSPDTSIVVLVDALDEGIDDQLPAGANKLFLPPSLPNRVYVVATTRPKADYRLAANPIYMIELKDEDDKNLRDIRAFIAQFIARYRERMVQALEAWGVSPDDFIKSLADHSSGNFMYLRYVLGDIRDGRLTKETLGDVYHLPTGISEYYRWHWKRTREVDPDHFDSVTKPVVCMFATAKEPVTSEQVVRWTHARWPNLSIDSIQRVVAQWREFLDEYRQTRSAPTYRIYHVSFQEFLRDVVGLGLYHDLIIDSVLTRAGL